MKEINNTNYFDDCNLSVGDKIDDFNFNYYQNGKFKQGKISDYSGK